MISLVKLIRPHQWIKNLFLLIPVFFAGVIFSTPHVLDLAIGFFVFCVISSSVYVINDLKDAPVDRLHPKKRERPIASGKVSAGAAIVTLVLLAVVGIAVSWTTLPIEFTTMVLTYYVLNLAYSFGLKKVAILDMMILSFGFILRVFAGGILGDVPVSEWLAIIIFLLSLFLAVAKRRDDVLIFEQSGTIARSSIVNYNLSFINAALTMLSGIIIVAYMLYTILSDVKQRIPSDYLYGTSIFVVTGILRYLQITLVNNNSSSPIKILYTDLFLQLTLVFWILSYFYLIYVS